MSYVSGFTARLILLYDANCAFCTASARLLRALGESEGLRAEPLQSPLWRAVTSAGPDEMRPDEMKLIRPDGSILGGGDALIELSRRLPILAGLYLWTRIPGVPAIIRRLYRFVARHRSCRPAACALKSPRGAGFQPAFPASRENTRGPARPRLSDYSEKALTPTLSRSTGRGS